MNMAGSKPILPNLMQVSKINLILLFIIHCVSSVTAVTSTESTNYLSKDETIGGIIFPAEVTAQVGSDVAIKLINPFAPPQVCQYRNPKSNKNNDIGSDRRILNWEQTSCGIIVKNVTKEDEGFWRLTSKRDNEFVRGVMSVVILDKMKIEVESTQMINDKDYCVIRRPDSEAFPKVGDCTIPQNEPGQWIVNFGSHGKYVEEQKEVFFEAKVGRLTTKIDRDSTKISISCNVVNIENTVEVCRFVRTMDGLALQVYDGLGGERYRYSGKGFEYGECGLTIENPDPLDKSLWKCYIQTHVMAGESMEVHNFGAIIDISDQRQNLRFEPALRRQALLVSTPSTLYCHSNLPISYCWFRKPNGEIMSVSEKETAPKHEEISKKYWYSGVGFGLGDCQITIDKAMTEDAGEWRCSVGEFGKTGYETFHTFNVEVRETDPMIVAETERIDINIGEPFQIECRTLIPHTPLESCHFVPPVGSGFSINEQVTSQNSLGNYYFNPNRKMSSGYCSLMVTRARKEHTGNWHCFAKSAIWTKEGSDRIQVVVREGISIASSTWLGVILAAIFITMLTTIAVGVLVKRRRQRVRQTRNEVSLEETRRTSNESTTDGESTIA